LIQYLLQRLELKSNGFKKIIDGSALPKGVETADNVNSTIESTVETSVAALVGSAPAVLDTLEELSAALGNDENFATTVTTALSGKSNTGHGHAISDVSNLQTSLNSKAPIASPTFTGTVSGITKTMVGLGNVDNTSDLSKPISNATSTALNLKANTADLTTGNGFSIGNGDRQFDTRIGAPLPIAPASDDRGSYIVSIYGAATFSGQALYMNSDLYNRGVGLDTDSSAQIELGGAYTFSYIEIDILCYVQGDSKNSIAPGVKGFKHTGTYFLDADGDVIIAGNQTTTTAETPNLGLSNITVAVEVNASKNLCISANHGSGTTSGQLAVWTATVRKTTRKWS